MRPPKCHRGDTSSLIFRKKAIPNPLRSLRMLGYLDNAVSILAGSILYMVYCSSHSSLSTIFSATYRLNQFQTGISYLAFGFGSLASTLVSGKLMDRDYKMVARMHNLSTDRVTGDDIRTFPIEKARLRSIVAPTLLACSSIIAYGWATDVRAVRAHPLSNMDWKTDNFSTFLYPWQCRLLQVSASKLVSMYVTLDRR